MGWTFDHYVIPLRILRNLSEKAILVFKVSVRMFLIKIWLFLSYIYHICNIIELYFSWNLRMYGALMFFLV